jgi:glycosyltransferase involved in cell wall biosynthesis
MFVVSLDSVIALRTQIAEGQYTNVENQLIEWVSTLDIETLSEILASDNDIADSFFICLRELFLSNYQISDSLFHALALNKFFISSIQNKSQFSVDIIIKELELLDKNQYSPIEIKLLLALFTFDSSINIPWQNLFTAIADATVVAYLGLGKTLDNRQTSNVSKNRRQYVESAKFAPLLNAEFIEDLIPLVSILEHCRNDNIVDVEPLTSWCVNCIKNFSHKVYQVHELNYEYNKTSPKVALIATRHNIENINELLKQFLELKINVSLLITEEVLLSKITVNKEDVHYITASVQDAAMAIQIIDADVLVYTSVTRDCFSAALIHQRLAHKQVVLDGNRSLQQITTLDILGNNESLESLVNRVLTKIESKPKLSICIPTYNRAELLRRSLEHLSNFNLFELEVNISNNGSTDHTLDVIEEYKNKFRNLNFVTYKNTISAHRNYFNVMSMATYDLSFAVADDDLANEAELLKAVMLIEENLELNVVYGTFDIVSLEKPTLKFNNKEQEFSGVAIFSSEQREEFVLKHLLLEVVLYRTSFFKEHVYMHSNSGVISWWLADKALQNGKLAISSFRFITNYIHNDRYSATEYASAHFYFSIESEVEGFISQINCTNEKKMELLSDYSARHCKFKLERCIDCKDYIQASFFIYKGLAYEIEEFTRYAALWNEHYLDLALSQYLIDYIKELDYINKVYICDELDSTYQKIINNIKPYIDKKFELNTEADVNTIDSECLYIWGRDENTAYANLNALQLNVIRHKLRIKHFNLIEGHNDK